MKAREIMTPHPEAVTPADLVQRAAEIMRDMDVGFVPIVSDRETMQLEGVITDRDITIRHVAAAHRRECKVHEHMTAERIATVGPEAGLDEVLEVMKRAQVRRVPVVEGNGRIIGVIAQADIALKESPSHPAEVAEAVEKISEPAQTHR